MHTYDAITNSGLHIHLSMSNNNTCYIFSRDIYNHVLTILSNIINNQKLTDAHTCYKMFNSNIFKKIKLEENDFSFCPEITTKIALLKIKIKEIPIKYNGRNYSEGKKIKFIDGVKAIITLFKYRFFK